MIIKKQVKLHGHEYYSMHLHIINPMLPIKLTNNEIEVLAYFMSFTGTIARDRFGTTARNIIKNEMGISNGGISNYVTSLKKKGFINNNEILPVLIPDESSQLYQFKLINDEKQDINNSK